MNPGPPTFLDCPVEVFKTVRLNMQLVKNGQKRSISKNIDQIRLMGDLSFFNFDSIHHKILC